MPLDVRLQCVSGLVSDLSVLLKAPHHDPVQVSFQVLKEILWAETSVYGSRRGLWSQQPEASGRPGWLDIANETPQFINGGGLEGLTLERCDAGQQLIQDHPKRIDIRARIDIDAAELRLFRTHVRRCADHLVCPREQGFFRELLSKGLGDAEIYDLRDRMKIDTNHEDVRRLQVAVNDCLLMRVLHSAADLV